MVIERGAFYRLSGLVFLLWSTTPPQPGHSNQGLWSRFWWGSCVCVLSRVTHVWFFAILWTVARQAPLSVEFSRQEFYWSGLSCPSPGDLPNSGTETSPALADGFFTTRTTRKPGGGLNGPKWMLCVCLWRGGGLGLLQSEKKEEWFHQSGLWHQYESENSEGMEFLKKSQLVYANFHFVEQTNCYWVWSC